MASAPHDPDQNIQAHAAAHVDMDRLFGRTAPLVAIDFPDMTRGVAVQHGVTDRHGLARLAAKMRARA